jgi:hypothetical protein
MYKYPNHCLHIYYIRYSNFPYTKKNIMKKILLFMMSFVLVCKMTAQQKNYWTARTDAAQLTTDKAITRQSFPSEFRLFDLNIEPLRQDLFLIASKTTRQSTVITLPDADGSLQQYEVFEASNFEPALQARFPEIRAFSGKGITDKSASLKISISPQGIQTIVFRTEKPNEFIEAYSSDHKVYAVFRSQRTRGSLPWNCSTPQERLEVELNAQVNGNIVARSGGNLKTMRLAQSVTAEYSNYFGATSSAQVSLVLAAVNATLTRCNGVYEKDLALHLNLIANTTSVFYYNPSTDPYSPASQMSQWNSQLQSTLTSVIGEANYDIGHLFGASGGGGNAGCIGCICVDGSKGKGITSPADGIPQGDNFDIDYVVHEVGHQLGANHTFSHSSEGTGVNKEPGSGITIMGYAGITSYDLAPHSIDIFHQASIAQIQSNLNTKTCPVTTTIVNATPVVNAGADYTIPISTPFALTGSATDADAGDVLTYCWEQNDNTTTTGSNSVASPTKSTGPNWISYVGSTSPTRLMPKLATILAGLNVSGPLTGGDAGANTEALSSVSRTLNFRLTVRDNAPYSSSSPVSVGQTQFDDMVVTVTNTSGPFAVTAPNTAVSWTGNSVQTVTWSVNNTTASPVSCANVKISISTDGGNTFSTLVSSTANDGSEAITVPNTPSTTARIKVEAVGNIFFDISNANFTITAGSSCGTPSGLSSSGITNTAATVSWTAVSGAVSYDVDYKAASSGTWINAATGTTSTSVNLSGLTQGTLYDWRVRTNCTAESSAYAQAQFTTTAPCNAPNGLASSSITSSSATVSWTAVSGAASYDVDYKLASSGTWINSITGTTATSRNITGLTASSLYDWRVRANCGASGSSGYSQAQFTTSAASSCPGPYDVSTNGSRSGAATIPFNTNIKGLISPSGDVDYYKFVITTGGTITLTLTTLPADYDLRLYRNGTVVASSSNGSTTSETINYTASANTYYARVVGYNGANNATNCYTLKVQLGTASRGEDLITGRVSAFPNPVSDVVNIKIADLQGSAGIRVFDIYGKLVMQQTSGQALTELNVSKLSAGLYMIKVSNNGKENTLKIVKE